MTLNHPYLTLTIIKTFEVSPTEERSIVSMSAKKDKYAVIEVTGGHTNELNGKYIVMSSHILEKDGTKYISEKDLILSYDDGLPPLPLAL